MSNDQKAQVQPGATAPMTIEGSRNGLNKPVDADGNREWSYGLCSCFDDCGTCLLSWWCPCIVYSQVKQRYNHLANYGTPDPDHGGTGCDQECLLFCCIHGLTHFGWVLTMFSRSSIRERYRINGDGCSDCLTSWLCLPCAMTQHSRELEVEETSLGAVKI